MAGSGMLGQKVAYLFEVLKSRMANPKRGQIRMPNFGQQPPAPPSIADTRYAVSTLIEGEGYEGLDAEDLKALHARIEAAETEPALYAIRDEAMALARSKRKRGAA